MSLIKLSRLKCDQRGFKYIRKRNSGKIFNNVVESASSSMNGRTKKIRNLKKGQTSEKFDFDG